MPCTSADVERIAEMYSLATQYMRSKNQVAWPQFSHSLITEAIKENRQWKIDINTEIACIWTITFEDPLIWKNSSNDKALYIHRIATHPNFRGRNLVKTLMDWANAYCRKQQLRCIRMDTVGNNAGLIKHYGKLGFEFLGLHTLDETDSLPAHYKDGPVCLFEKNVTAS